MTKIKVNTIDVITSYSIHYTKLYDKAVVLPIDDIKWGKSGIAFVTVSNPQLNADTIRKELKGSLADYKIPKSIFILEEIPLTSLGKISRKKLHQYFNSLISER